MARIRSIKPEFFTDEELGQLPAAVRLLFIAMWTEADKAGRLKDKPKTIKTRCLPFDNVNIETALTQLANEKFIIRYQVDGEAYIQIRTWSEHQRPHHTERDSLIPEMVNGYLTVKEPLVNGVNVSVNPPFPSLPVFVFPDSLKGDVGFAEAWEAWVVHRKQIKKPLTGEQTKKQLAAFGEWGAARSIAAIEHTIRQGWQGLREPEGANGKPAVDQGKADSEAAFAAAAERRKQREAEANGQP